MTHNYPGIDYSLLPEHLRAGMERYIEHGILPGHFLQAVLSNNLVEAFFFLAGADADALLRMGAIATFLYNEAPAPAWGSEDKMRAWSRARQKSEQS